MHVHPCSSCSFFISGLATDGCCWDAGGALPLDPPTETLSFDFSGAAACIQKIGIIAEGFKGLRGGKEGERDGTKESRCSEAAVCEDENGILSRWSYNVL